MSMTMTAVAAVVLGLTVAVQAMGVIGEGIRQIVMVCGLVFTQMIGSRTLEGFMHIRQRRNRLKQCQQ